jgi:hypothetical protein
MLMRGLFLSLVSCTAPSHPCAHPGPPAANAGKFTVRLLRDGRSNVATASLMLVRNSADSPAPLLRPSPANGHDAEILDVSDPDLGYDAETCPYQQPQRIMWTYFHRLNR